MIEMFTLMIQPMTGDGAIFNNNKGEIVFLNTENGELVPLTLKEQSVGIGTTNPLQASRRKR